MNMNKKLMTLASAVVMMGAASLASATTYEIGGSGTTLTLAPAFGGAFPTGTVAATQTVDGFGEVNDAGGVFNSAVFTTTVVVTSPLDAALLQTIVTEYNITDGAGNGTTEVLDCTEQVGGTSCGDLGVGVIAMNPADLEHRW